MGFIIGLFHGLHSSRVSRSTSDDCRKGLSGGENGIAQWQGTLVQENLVNHIGTSSAPRKAR